MLDFAHLEQYRENNRIEAKKALGGLPKSIWETYSAFANTMGGVILLGVVEHKDKTLHPVNLPDPEHLVREFWDKINNPAITNMNILTQKNIQIRNINGNRIIVITVPRATRQEKPIYINKSVFDGSYRRNGEGDYKCNREEVLGMQRDALIMSPDMKLLTWCGLEVFDGLSLQCYRKRLKAYSPGHPWERLSDDEFLCELGAVELDEQDRMCPTAAGLLMFGQKAAILQEFPEYRLSFQWKGKTFQGGNLYDFYIMVCDYFAKHMKELPIGDKKQMRPFLHYALREALSNCLMNADYYGKGGICVTFSEAGFVFRNPGAFRVSVETARTGGISDPRNVALVKMFQLLDIGDSSGDGLSQIYAIWQEMGWESPKIKESFAPDATELILKTQKADGGKRTDGKSAAAQANRRLVIHYLTGHASATEVELTEFMGLNATNAKVLLDDLIALGIIEIKEKDVYRLKA